MRLRYLSEARRAEPVASSLKDESAQDEILDETVWRRLLASLPSYNPERQSVAPPLLFGLLGTH